MRVYTGGKYLHPLAAARVMRGVGQFVGPTQQNVNVVSTPSGDYGVYSDGTIVDPNGNYVTSIPGYTQASGPIQPGQTLPFIPGTSPAAAAPSSLASLFPGVTGTTNVFGANVPSWLVPVGLILGALVLYKGFTK
jgi:hypothetical protein